METIEYRLGFPVWFVRNDRILAEGKTDGSEIATLRSGKRKCLALFTSQDSVAQFLREKQDPDSVAAVLPGRAEMIALLEKMLRGGCTYVAFDPAHSANKAVRIDRFLRSLKEE
jgi:hypothetical protein